MSIQKLDTCNLFQEEMNAKMQFRGNLSVRRDKNKETTPFQSRAFGFGMELNGQQLEEINFFYEGKKYADECAAIAKQGSTYKKKTYREPFCIQV
jgi:hypothetical protein